MSDLEYYNKGMFTTFLPNTPEGEKAYNDMVKQSGTDTFLTIHLKTILYQLRKAGYKVSKLKKPKETLNDILNDPILKELGI